MTNLEFKDALKQLGLNLTSLELDELVGLCTMEGKIKYT